MSKFSKKKDGKESQAPKKGKEKADKEDKTQSPSHSPVSPVKEQKEPEVKVEVNPPEEQKVESERKDWKKVSYCMRYYRPMHLCVIAFSITLF